MEIIQHAAIFLSIVAGLVLVLTISENLYWKNREPSKVYGALEIFANFFLGASYKMIDAVAVAVYVYFLYDIVSSYGLGLSFSGNWWWFPIVYILADLFFYVTHYMMHKIRWFWTAHVTHHSSDRYNFSVALRQNFTVVINGALLIWWLPMAIIGVDKYMVLMAIEINLIYQLLLHTEMPTFLDRLGLVMNTPSHHRVHHGNNTKQIDRNFGGTFIIWDKLFGTFRAEKEAGELIYGITRNQPKGYNPLILIFHEWRDMLMDVFKYRNVKILFKGPDWVDTMPQRQTKTSKEKGL